MHSIYNRYIYLMYIFLEKWLRVDVVSQSLFPSPTSLFRVPNGQTFILFGLGRHAVSSIKFPAGTKFRPSAKLLASLNAFGSDPVRTKCSIPEWENGKRFATHKIPLINGRGKPEEMKHSSSVLRRYVFVTFHRYLLVVAV